MPLGSMRKYFADQGGPNHGGDLTWPGTADGYPFRGPVPDLRQEEYQEIPLALDFKTQVFFLWDPSSKAEFESVMDRIVNGWYMQHKRVDRWSDQHCGLIVWLEWVQVYGETPHGKHPGVSHGQTIQQATGSGPFGIVPTGQGGPTPPNARPAIPG